jgi:hypothetical protein
MASAQIDPANLWIDATIYRNTYDKKGKAYAGTLGDLIGEIHRQIECTNTDEAEEDSKLACRAFGPHIRKPGAVGRKNKLIDAVSALVLDFDHKTTDEAASLVENFSDLCCVLYTTWSNAKRDTDDNCFRVVLPLTRPLTVKEFGRVYPYVARLVGSDTQVCDPARLFFLPACPTYRAEGASVIWNAGTLLDTEELVEEAPKVKPSSPKRAPHAAGDADIGNIKSGEMWERLSATGKPWVAALSAGKPFAKKGTRDSTLHEIVSTLAFLFPTADPDALLDLLAPSLEAMAARAPEGDPAPTVEDARAKLERALSDAAEVVAVEEEIAEALRVNKQRLRRKQRERIEDEEETAKKERYTEEEIAAFADEQGCTPEEFDHRWIIQHSGAYFLFADGAYKLPVGKEDLPVAAYRYLRRAPVRFFSRTQTGVAVPVPMVEILRNHSTVALTVKTTLVEPHSRYDARSETFYEAAAPLRRIKPRYDEQVDKWLRLLGGAQAEKLLDWVATLTLLDRPSCAVYLYGKADAGKSLFALGLARIYEYGIPTKGKQVLQNDFNSALTGCPIVHIDEALPQKPGRRQTTAELRELITDDRRPLQRKYLPDSVLEGSLRFILTANNDRLLVTKEELDNDDLRAIASRFMMINVGTQETGCPAADYLAALGGREGTRDWVSGNRIARHALWLRDNRKVVSRGRLLVEGNVHHTHEKLAWSSGINTYVCEWIVKAIEQPQKIRGSAFAKFLRVGNGRILVNPGAVSELWETYVKSEKLPALDLIGKALKGLSLSQQHVRLKNSGRVRMWSVSPDLITAWARERLVSDPDLLEERINAPLEEDEDDTETTDGARVIPLRPKKGS